MSNVNVSDLMRDLLKHIIYAKSVCQHIRRTLDLEPISNTNKITDSDQLQSLVSEFAVTIPPLPNIVGLDAPASRKELVEWLSEAKQHSAEHSYVGKLPVYPAPEWLQQIEMQLEMLENSVTWSMNIFNDTQKNI